MFFFFFFFFFFLNCHALLPHPLFQCFFFCFVFFFFLFFFFVWVNKIAIVAEKLELIKQNVIFRSFFFSKILIIKGNNSWLNKCTHVSNNHNRQFFKIKFQNNFRPIANTLFVFFFKLLYYYQFYTCFSYKSNSYIVIRGCDPCQKKRKKLTWGNTAFGM